MLPGNFVASRELLPTEGNEYGTVSAQMPEVRTTWRNGADVTSCVMAYHGFLLDV